jgi:hypothetical protein
MIRYSDYPATGYLVMADEGVGSGYSERTYAYILDIESVEPIRILSKVIKIHRMTSWTHNA